MATTEHTINDVLAELLRGTRRAWRDTDIVSSENTGQPKGSTARPDILVVEPNVSPVVIETEVVPAVTVETEALDRLGAKMRTTGRTILSSIAVRLPLRLRDKSGKALQEDLFGSADLEMALYTGSRVRHFSRFSRSGLPRASSLPQSDPDFFHHPLAAEVRLRRRRYFFPRAPLELFAAKRFRNKPPLTRLLK